MSFKVPNQYRIKNGPCGSDDSIGPHGAFFIPRLGGNEAPLKIIATAGNHEIPWEHVSVSLPSRCPNWNEMCLIKDIFWDKEDLVIQLHPPESQYVNNHSYCLHLWRKAGTNDFLETPPTIAV